MTDKSLTTRNDFLAAAEKIPPRDRPAWLQAHAAELTAIEAAEKQEAEVVRLRNLAIETAQARKELKTRKRKKSRKIVRRLTDETRERIKDAERLGREEGLPPIPFEIPRGWIMDGSWAVLQPVTCKVLVVLRRLLDPQEEWTCVDRDVLIALSACSGRTLRRALKEAEEEGWLLTRKAKVFRNEYALNLYAWPPAGVRVPMKVSKSPVKEAKDAEGLQENAEEGG